MRQSARAMHDQIEDAFTSISIRLRSVLLDTLGLAAAIEWHVRQFQKCTGIPCALNVDNAAGIELPEVYAGTVFNIYNEALSNVARHAGAHPLAVALTITPSQISVVVHDNGAGHAISVRLPIV